MLGFCIIIEEMGSLRRLSWVWYYRNGGNGSQRGRRCRQGLCEGNRV